MSDIPLKVSGVPQTLTITKTTHTDDGTPIGAVMSHQETIVLPDADLPVTLTGVDGAEKCGKLVLRAGSSWTLTIGSSHR